MIKTVKGTAGSQMKRTHCMHIVALVAPVRAYLVLEVVGPWVAIQRTPAMWQ